MKEWVEPNIWERLSDVFARFDAADSWRALEAAMDLFREIAQETAHRLRYGYPKEVSKNLSKYIESLRRKQES